MGAESLPNTFPFKLRTVLCLVYAVDKARKLITAVTVMNRINLCSIV